MRLIAGYIFITSFLFAQSAADFLAQGEAEFQKGRYAEAALEFELAVKAEPGSIRAHLYLAKALMTQFVPGMDTRENAQFAEQARAEFMAVLGIDARNVDALSSLASLAYMRSQFEEARKWNRETVAIDPANKQAYFTLGVIAWTEWMRVDGQARIDSGQSADAPGPIGNRKLREELKAKFLPVLDQGIQDEEAALRVDANYDDAMAYLNLLIRYRADLLDTREQYEAEVERANGWARRATEVKKSQAPAEMPGGTMGGLRVGGSVMAANLVSMVKPVYPEQAREAGIAGTVQFYAVIGKDGHIENLTLMSGHPLLVQAAHDAVAQWVYKPVLLNGEPAQIITTIVVNFTLRP